MLLCVTVYGHVVLMWPYGEKEAGSLICARKVIRSQSFWKALARIVAGFVLITFSPSMPLRMLGPIVVGWGLVGFFQTRLPSCPSGRPCCVA